MKGLRTLGASTSMNTDKLEGLGTSVVAPPPPPPEGGMSRGLLKFGPFSPMPPPPPPLFLLSLSLSSLTPDMLPLSPPLER